MGRRKVNFGTHTHTHICFTALWTLSRITHVSRYQNQPGFYWNKSDSVIRWAICKSAPRPTHINTSESHHSVFLHIPDALPAAQPVASKHWRRQTWKYNRHMSTVDISLPRYLGNLKGLRRETHHTTVNWIILPFSTGISGASKVLQQHQSKFRHQQMFRSYICLLISAQRCLFLMSVVLRFYVECMNWMPMKDI